MAITVELVTPSTRRQHHLVCHCRAYSFPHLWVSAKCSGRRWVEEYREDNLCGYCRRECMMDEGSTCAPADGREPASLCPALREFWAYEMGRSIATVKRRR